MKTAEEIKKEHKEWHEELIKKFGLSRIDISYLLSSFFQYEERNRLPLTFDFQKESAKKLSCSGLIKWSKNRFELTQLGAEFIDKYLSI